MGLTRDFKETVQNRLNRDPEFREELLKELMVDFNYKMTIDLDMARMYAKRKCKVCHGKGYQVVIHASSGKVWSRDVTPLKITRIASVQKRK